VRPELARTPRSATANAGDLERIGALNLQACDLAALLPCDLSKKDHSRAKPKVRGMEPVLVGAKRLQDEPLVVRVVKES